MTDALQELIDLHEREAAYHLNMANDLRIERAERDTIARQRPDYQALTPRDLQVRVAEGLRK
jgi:hypothetical protein